MGTRLAENVMHTNLVRYSEQAYDAASGVPEKVAGLATCTLVHSLETRDQT
jgi:hypothetical protein